MNFKIFLMLFSAIITVSCVSTGNKNMSEDKFSSEFERGSKALEDKDYPLAAQIFDQLRTGQPTSETDFIALFNAAVAYENMKECQQAAIRYRQVIQGAVKKYPRFQAQAHFNLSSVYDCLGDDTKAMSSMLEARKLKAYLPPQLVWTEMPAKLAAYYAELGDRTNAMKFFDEASQGLKRVGSENADSKKFNERMARILFLMGRLSDRDMAMQTNPVRSLKAVEFQQAFLLQSVEMDKDPWSRDAQIQILTAYRSVSRWMAKPNYEGKDVIQEALIQLRALKGIRFPKESERSSEMFAQLEGEEKKWMAYLAKAAEVNRLTPESQKRDGLKRSYKAKPLKGK